MRTHLTPYSAHSQSKKGQRQGEKEGNDEGEEKEEIPGLGFLSYVVDGGDGTMRACALRTIVVRRIVCLSCHCMSVSVSVRNKWNGESSRLSSWLAGRVCLPATITVCLSVMKSDPSYATAGCTAVGTLYIQ
jgi:hypothetical protein